MSECNPTKNEYKRISPTTVEIDGEKYTKDYTTSFHYDDNVFTKIKSLDDALKTGELTDKRLKQLSAFEKLAIFADVINEGKERDENGFLYYVYYNQEHSEFFICEHTYSIRHTIYFASRKLAQYSIKLCRDTWKDYYGISE